MDEKGNTKHRKAWILAVIALILALYSLSELSVLAPSGNTTNYYNYTNGSGGGSVSFNGSAVDLNGSIFYNGSQQTGTFNHSNLTRLAWELSGHTSDNSKVNKSGDNMTGILNMNNNTISNINNISYNGGKTFVNYSVSDDVTYYFWDVGYPIMNFVGTPDFRRRISTGFPVNSVQGALVLGLENNPSVTNGGGTGLVIYLKDTGVDYSGYYGYVGEPGYYVGRMVVVWSNKSANTTELDIILKNDSTDKYANSNKVARFFSNGTLMLPAMAGSGNDYACFDSTGKLFRSNVAC